MQAVTLSQKHTCTYRCVCVCVRLCVQVFFIFHAGTWFDLEDTSDGVMSSPSRRERQKKHDTAGNDSCNVWNVHYVPNDKAGCAEKS